jgi:glycosyltransferase involved in cell wall biosynthesis
MQPTSSPSPVSPEKAPSTALPGDAFVSIILPHYNDLENLKVCLSLLDQQSFPRSRFEIIVAENNSACGLDAVVQACGAGVKVVLAVKQGAAEARNAAVAASSGQILAFIDSDCRPESQWLERGVAALARADLVGGRVDVSVADPLHPTAVEAFEKIFAFNYRRYIEEEGFAVTANMFAPRAIFDRVGGFRAGYAEDLDWGQRAVKMGYGWYCAADAGVSHPARRDWSELTKKWRRLAKESFVGMQERSAWRLRWIARTLALPPSAVVHVPQALFYDGEKDLQFKLKAIGILFAIRFWRFREGFRLLFG